MKTFWTVMVGSSWFGTFALESDAAYWLYIRTTKKGVQLTNNDGSSYFTPRSEFRITQAYFERQNDGTDIVKEVRHGS
jgi:hypothetical protein